MLKRVFKIQLRTEKANFYYFTCVTAPTRRLAIIRAKLEAYARGYRKTVPYLVREECRNKFLT